MELRTYGKVVLLIAAYLLVALLPLGFAWAQGLPSMSLRDEIGAGLGLLAFSIILVEFVLSGRFKSISRDIGMDVTMRFHQLMARSALAFAIVHPFAYSQWTQPMRPWDPTQALGPSAGFGDLWSGIVAYLLLPTFVLVSIARRKLDYSYEAWRLMHGLGAVIIAAALLHHTLEAGRYSAGEAMFYMWWVLFAVAVGSLFYVYAIAPLGQLSRPWRVAQLERLTPHQWGLTISPDGHDGINYRAGQFVWINVGHSAYSLFENPFSIASAPASGKDLGFVIKELGDFTSALDEVPEGTRVFVDGPFGNLSVDGRDEPGVGLIAGGVGIAPTLSILRELAATNDPRDAVLVYGNRRKEQIVFSDELAGYEASGTARIINVLAEPPDDWKGETGYPDRDFLARTFTPEQLSTWVFVLCGPNIMMDIVEQSLINLGTPAQRILSERFSYD